jgi:hypothetical protein
MWAHEHLKKLEEQYQQYTIAEASQPKSNIDNAEAIRYQTVQEVVDRAQSAVNKLIDKFDNFSQLDDIRIHILSTIEFADKYFRKENTISDATIKFINNVSSFMQSIREILKNSTKNKALDHSDIIKLTNNIKLLKNYTNNISDQLQQIFNVKDEDKQEFNHIMQQLRNTIATLCSWATDQAQTLEKSYKSQQETRKKEKQEQQGQNTNSYSNMLKRFFNYIRGH